MAGLNYEEAGISNFDTQDRLSIGLEVVSLRQLRKVYMDRATSFDDDRVALLEEVKAITKEINEHYKDALQKLADGNVNET